MMVVALPPSSERKLINPIDYYDQNAKRLADRYEARTFEDVHCQILDYLPSPPARILDVGAGSGRDAAWFAAHGYHVIAVEPAAALRDLGKTLHSDTGITWIDDQFPDLQSLQDREEKFDAIIASAVWMHLTPKEQHCSVVSLARLLKPGARAFVSFRSASKGEEVKIFDVTLEKLTAWAQRCGLKIIAQVELDDPFERSGVNWMSLILEKG